MGVNFKNGHGSGGDPGGMNTSTVSKLFLIFSPFETNLSIKVKTQWQNLFCVQWVFGNLNFGLRIIFNRC